MRIRARTAALTVVALAVAASLAAAAGEASVAAKKKPIRLMVIAAVATPIQDYPAAPAGAQAAAAAINKAGGIKGQRVIIDVCNTKSDPNVAVSCARRAASNHDVAVVGHIEAQSSLTIPVLKREGIADVGNYSTGDPIDWTNPNVFPIAGGSPSIFMTLPFALKKLGKKNLAVMYLDVPAGLSQAKIVQQVAKNAGLNVAGLIPIPTTATAFDPYVFKLKSLDADSAILLTSIGATSGLMTTATSLGVNNVLFSHTTSTVGEDVAKQIGAPAVGMLLGAAYPSYRDTQYRVVRTWLKEMRAAGKGDSTLLKPEGLNSWLAVYAVADTVRSMKGPITNVTLLKALRHEKKGFNLFGLTKWNPGVHGPKAYPRWQPNLKVFLSTVKPGGKIVAWGKALPPMEPLVLRHLVK